MLPVLLSLALAATPAEGLAEARAAFAKADYPRAERLALAVAAPPQAGAAWYLVALARFRQDRPADALAALDTASVSADPPPAAEWHYNRGACLQALDRHAEAEREFLAAADLGGALAPVALVGAGYAALDAGARDRARAHAARARRLASGPAVSLVDDLDTAVATTTDGAGGPLPPAEATRSSARAWEAVVRLDGGWDSDALQTGFSSLPERTVVTPTQAASALASLSAALDLRLELGGGLSGEVGYGLAQLAYLSETTQDRSVQQHGVSGSLVWSPRPTLQLGLGAVGELALAGLSSFRAMQASAGLRSWGAVDEAAWARTRLDAGWSHKEGLGAEFGYLSGDRLEAALLQRVAAGIATLDVGGRIALEAIGDLRTSAPASGVPLVCRAGCTQVLVEPLGYLGRALFASARFRLASWLELSLSAGVEWRDYRADRRWSLASADGATAVEQSGRRHDLRWSGAETLTIALAPRLALALRHEFLRSRSDVTGASCAPLGELCSFAEAVPGYDKHVLTVGTSWAW